MLPSPTRAGGLIAVAAGAAVAGGVVLGLRDLVAVGAGLCAAIVAAAVAVSGRPDALERRVLTPRVTEGMPARAELVVRCRRRRRGPGVRVTVHDPFAGVRVEVPPGPATVVPYDLPARGRGVYLIEPVRLDRLDALGVLRSRHRSDDAATLRVHPRVVPVRPGWLGRTDDDESGSSPARAAGSSLHALRAYEPGDDVRLIHWPSSARAGAALVRDTVLAGEPSLLVLLDTDPSSYADPAMFEDAVRVAASIAVAGWERRLPVRVRTPGGLDRRVGRAPADRVRLLDDLAGVAAVASGGAGLGGLIAGAARVDVVVIVTGERARPPRAVLRRAGRCHGDVTVIRLGSGGAEPLAGEHGVRDLTAASALSAVRSLR